MGVSSSGVWGSRGLTPCAGRMLTRSHACCIEQFVCSNAPRGAPERAEAISSGPREEEVDAPRLPQDGPCQTDGHGWGAVECFGSAHPGQGQVGGVPWTDGYVASLGAVGQTVVRAAERPGWPEEDTGTNQALRERSADRHQFTDDHEAAVEVDAATSRCITWSAAPPKPAASYAR